VEQSGSRVRFQKTSCVQEPREGQAFYLRDNCKLAAQSIQIAALQLRISCAIEQIYCIYAGICTPDRAQFVFFERNLEAF
jgi:hypothetical protein